jgi:biotin-independent malonate decarboxylase gamma subunit
MQADEKGEKRAIVAIVDVPSQAYGRREELLGIFLAAAAATDAYVSARLAGHPVISLLAGHAISGGYLTHGAQSNRLLAFNDPGVVIHAMSKKAAALVTRRTVAGMRAEEFKNSRTGRGSVRAAGWRVVLGSDGASPYQFLSP